MLTTQPGDVLLEKREYSDGVRYAQATVYQPGVSYYVQRKDDQGREYYFNTNPAPSGGYMATTAPGMNPMMSYGAPQGGAYPPQYAAAPSPYAYSTVVPLPPQPGSYQPQPGMLVGPSDPSKVKFGGLAAGHVIVTVLSLFLPFFYLLSFPCLFGALKSFIKKNNLGDDPTIGPKVHSYTALGWVTFFFVLIGHFFMVCGWPLSVVYHCDYYNGCYLSQNPPAFVIAIIGTVFSGIAWFMNLALAIQGGTFIKN